MFAANETAPKSGRVEQDALQDIQAGRSSTRWFSAGGGALWAAAPHSMVRWEERRGTAGGSGPAVLEPSASTMSPPKGEGGGAELPAGPAAPGGRHGRSTGTIPTRFPRRKRDPRADSPCRPPTRGSGTVLSAGGCGTGRHHCWSEGGKGLRGAAGSCWGGALPACLPALPLSSCRPGASPRGVALLRPRCVGRGCSRYGACRVPRTPPPLGSATVACPPTASSPLGASDRGAASLGLIPGHRRSLHRDIPCTHLVGAEGVPGNAVVFRCLLGCV